MSEEGTITLKNGIVLEIKEWIKRREEEEKSGEYIKECQKEIIDLKKCIKKRTVKKIISPEYEPKFSEVRHLTDEEIVKEYIMSDQEIQEKKSKAYRILALLKGLGGRGVITSIIASGIKENKRNISAILSQLRSAGLIDSTRSPGNRKIFLWKMNKEANVYSLEQMVVAYNDHVRSVRKRSGKGQIIPPTKDQEQRGEWKKRNRKIIVQEEEEEKSADGIRTMTKEEIEEAKKRIKEISREYSQEINYPEEKPKIAKDYRDICDAYGGDCGGGEKCSLECFVSRNEDKDDGIVTMTEKEIEEMKIEFKKITEEQSEEIRELKEKLNLSTPPSSQVVRVIIEGSIRILIGLDK